MIIIGGDNHAKTSRTPESGRPLSCNVFGVVNYTDLRMIYEKLSKRNCPNCNREIIASECKEEVEKSESSFKVYMYCSHCNHRMEKLTRTHFSYNTREGACKTCQGLGKVLKVNGVGFLIPGGIVSMAAEA